MNSWPIPCGSTPCFYCCHKPGCRGTADGSLSAHLSALAPLAPHLKQLSLTCSAKLGMDAAAAAALCHALPCLQQLWLTVRSTSAAAAPASGLPQLVAGLPALQRLVLQMRLVSPSDLVEACLDAERQAQAGHRRQPLTLLLYGGRGVVPGGAAAVSQVLAQGGQALAHVAVQE